MTYFRFYHIKDEYVAYLYRLDRRAQYNKGARRPYVGVVLQIRDMNYYVPLESPKPNHAHVKSGGPILKMDDGKLGIMGFNNMIPVRMQQLIEFDIANEKDQEYRMLLLKQLHFCAENKDVILNRAKTTYAKAVSGKNPFYQKVCCDFRKLESACRRYNPNWKPKPRRDENR